MAFLIPLIGDIVPMISPGHVQVTKSTDLDSGTGQTEGMIRKGAIANKSDKLCASGIVTFLPQIQAVMIAHPHTESAVHHHGEQDTIIYAVSGTGTIISEGGNSKQVLSPGDFALIPAWAEHQEVNEGEEEVTWVITRSGGEPVVVNLSGWGGDVKK